MSSMQSLFQGKRGKNTMTAIILVDGVVVTILDKHTSDKYRLVKGKTGFRLRRVDE